MVLQQDCADFGLAPPELSNIGEVEDDLNKQQAGKNYPPCDESGFGSTAFRSGSSHMFL